MRKRTWLPWWKRKRVMFTLHYPAGYEGDATAELSTRLHRVTLEVSPEGDELWLKFPPPFDDLLLRNGETLTREKAGYLGAALAYLEDVS